MNVQSNSTLRGLDLISMTESQRVRVQDALRVSEMIVSAMLRVVEWFGGASAQVKQDRQEPRLGAAK
jgi:hypothetical protein